MSIRFNDILIVLGLWVIVQSCDPCEDCGQSLEFNPSVNLIFINQDSLVQLENSIDHTDSLIEIINNIQSDLTDTISYWNDSIDIVEIAIDSGQIELEDYLIELNLLVDLFQDTVTTYRSKINTLDSMNSVLISIGSDISSGLIKPEKITVVNNELVFEYEDSANVFVVPLVLLETMTRYEIILEGEAFNIEVTYRTEELINEERQVIISATNIIPTSDTFDSLNYDCNNRQECLNNETDVTLYF